MSIEAISLVLNHSQAKGRAKLVLIGIANHLGDNGAWPSMDTLARYAGTSKMSVHRDLKLLVELGELVIETHGGPTKGKAKTNRYWITIEANNVTNYVPNNVTKSVNNVTNTTEQRNTVVTQNIINHQIEPRNTFDLFWAVYPRRIAKGQAEKAWAKLNPDDNLLAVILAAVESFDWAKDERFIPYPATWITARRWEDEKPADDEWVATF